MVRMSVTEVVYAGGVTVMKKVVSSSNSNSVVDVSITLQGTCDVNVLVVVDGL